MCLGIALFVFRLMKEASASVYHSKIRSNPIYSFSFLSSSLTSLGCLIKNSKVKGQYIFVTVNSKPMLVSERLKYCKQKEMWTWVLLDILRCARTEVGLGSGGSGGRAKGAEGTPPLEPKIRHSPPPWAAAYWVFFFFNVTFTRRDFSSRPQVS